MSTELEFLNFCISLHKRLGPIIDKWQRSKKLEIMNVDDEKMMDMIHFIFWEGKYGFGNDNRNPNEIIGGE
jgi:hypothetical protein